MTIPVPRQVYSRATEILEAQVDGQIILMHTESWQYFEFDAVAGAIWSLLETPKNLDELVFELTARFDVDPEQCARDIFSFMTELTASGLFSIQNH